MQQQTAQMEHKLDTVVMVMGGLGLLEIQDDTHQEPEIHLFGASVLNSKTSQCTIFNTCFFLQNQSVLRWRCGT